MTTKTFHKSTTGPVLVRTGLYWTGMFWSGASNHALVFDDEQSANAARLVVGGEVTACRTNGRMTLNPQTGRKRWRARWYGDR